MLGKHKNWCQVVVKYIRMMNLLKQWLEPGLVSICDQVNYAILQSTS